MQPLRTHRRDDNSERQAFTSDELQAIERHLAERGAVRCRGARRDEPAAVDPVATAGDPIYEAWREFQRTDKPMREVAAALGLKAPALWKAFAKRGLRTRKLRRMAA